MATINGTPLDDTINGLAGNDTLGAGRGGPSRRARALFRSRPKRVPRACVNLCVNAWCA